MNCKYCKTNVLDCVNTNCHCCENCDCLEMIHSLPESCEECGKELTHVTNWGAGLLCGNCTSKFYN